MGSKLGVYSKEFGIPDQHSEAVRTGTDTLSTLEMVFAVCIQHGSSHVVAETR
jgi:hypothetical protein